MGMRRLRSKSRASAVVKRTKSTSLSLMLMALLLALGGLLSVFEASSVRSLQEVGHGFYYFRLQFIWVALGVVVMIVTSLIPYKRWQDVAFFAMMGSIILLLGVLIPGIGVKVGGARRWIDLGFFNLQPTEIAKFSVIIYLASWFEHKERKRFVPFLSLLGVLMFLILLQPDMGTAIIIFSVSIIMFFLAGSETRYLLMLIPASVVGFILLAQSSPYRLRRLLAFLDPSADPQGIGYHINQIMISLHNGGLFGQGFGASKQKYLYLPEAHTDSIFAIFSEEFGFVGSMLLVFAFFALLYKMYRICYRAPDRFGQLLAAGIMGYFALQIIINLGGMTALLPLTGVPLPFISYGGSSMLVSFGLAGILTNIERTSAKRRGVGR